MKTEFEIYMAQVAEMVSIGRPMTEDEIAFVRSYWREGADAEVAADELCGYVDSDSGSWANDDDGQPSEYDEWQDFYGGDDWDHGQFESEY